MIIILVILAVIIGGFMPIQAALNSELSKVIRLPYLGALISFLGGTIVLSLIALPKGVPINELKKTVIHHPQLFIGGLLGALFVVSSIFLVPRMGATLMIGAFVTGQLLMSVVIDHYGLFGLPVQQINTVRLLGIILLFAGLFLVLKKTA